MDVDLNLPIPRPTRDAYGNAIWPPTGALAGIPARAPAGSPMPVAPSGVPIHFRHIAFLLLGGIFGGIVVGIFASLVARGFTKSTFVAWIVFGSAFYGSLILGYHWSARERDWIGLRARFTPVGRTPLILGALTAPALIAVTTMLGFILKAIGITLKDTPEPPILPHHWAQLPFAFLLIVILAPICEELFFRGLLLDWLKQKINVWIAALILSVVFSLLHLNPFSLGAVGWLAFFHRFLMGISASALAIKYRSLWPSFTLHATVNGIACIAAMVE
jgi:membrane protease YdiL (CAAX protease family)